MIIVLSGCRVLILNRAGTDPPASTSAGSGTGNPIFPKPGTPKDVPAGAAKSIFSFGSALSSIQANAQRMVDSLPAMPMSAGATGTVLGTVSSTKACDRGI